VFSAIATDNQHAIDKYCNEDQGIRADRNDKFIKTLRFHRFKVLLRFRLHARLRFRLCFR
jgi:hypothetical protein